MDIADGVAFYDRLSDGAGDYFFERKFDDIEALEDTAGYTKSILGVIAKLRPAILI